MVMHISASFYPSPSLCLALMMSAVDLHHPMCDQCPYKTFQSAILMANV